MYLTKNHEKKKIITANYLDLYYEKLQQKNWLNNTRVSAIFEQSLIEKSFVYFCLLKNTKGIAHLRSQLRLSI